MDTWHWVDGDLTFMKLFLSLAFAFALSGEQSHAATYLLLSQTNAFAASITNAAKAYTDAHTSTNAANWVGSVGTNSTLTGTASAGGFSLGGSVLSEWPFIIDTNHFTADGFRIYNALSAGSPLTGQVQISYSDPVNGSWGPNTVLDTSFSLGQSNDVNVISYNNADITLIGGLPGWNTMFTNNYHFVGIGYNVMAAEVPGTVFNGNFAMFGFGDAPFYKVKMTNSSQFLSLGYISFNSAVVNNSQYVSDLGWDNWASSTLTSSTNLMALGRNNGSGINGSFSDIYLIGHSAVPTKTNDQVVVKSADILLDGNVTVTGTAAFNAMTIGTLTPTNIASGLVTGNLGVQLGVGVTNYVDFTYATRTNNISQNISFAYATNAVDGVEISHKRLIKNTSGANVTCAFPSGWITNKYLPFTFPVTITNGTTLVFILAAEGSTATSALQTNVTVETAFFK